LPKATEGSSALQMVVSRREAAAAGVGLAVLTLLPSEAVADMTLNTFKKSYFRWVPRIEAGRDFFVLELGAQIDNQQWAEVLKAFELSSVAQAGSAREANGVSQKSTRVDRELLTPMRVWVTSFAEKGTSPKQRKMDAQVAILAASMEKIRNAAEKQDADSAEAAWETARKAFNSYIKIANKGMTMQVRDLELIPEDASEYKATEMRPVNTYSQTGQATQRFQYCDSKGCVK